MDSTPDRQQALAAAFILLAETLDGDHDVADVADRLVVAALEILPPVAAAAVMLDDGGKAVVLASSDHKVQTLELHQLQAHEGPCLECIRTGRVVESVDLSREQRWPAFVPAALAMGFQSVTAVPVRPGSTVIGALPLLCERPGALGPEDLHLAEAMAAVAGYVITNRRAEQRQHLHAEQLQHALDSRVIIEQAKGMLASHHAINLEAAFERLRAYCRSHNRKLTEVAAEVVDGRRFL